MCAGSIIMLYSTYLGNGSPEGHNRPADHLSLVQSIHLCNMQICTVTSLYSKVISELCRGQNL